MESLRGKRVWIWVLGKEGTECGSGDCRVI